MLEIRKTAVPLDEEEMMELEQIIVDRDEDQALKFLRKAIYNKIARSQRGKLQSDMDVGN